MLKKMMDYLRTRLPSIVVGLFVASVFILPSSFLFAIELRSVKILDSLRTARDKYSSSERVTFSAEVYSASAGERINFSFVVFNPLNTQVFTHTGNSIPGTAGAGGSELANVPISQFYSGFGNYALEVTATPIGGSAVKQRIAFTVYSPIIILSYPGNGAKDLIDQPLTFRWIGSGASKYKLYVDDDQAFYNTMFTFETMDTFCSYPQNPSDTRQKLVSGQVYYWKVDGLDAVGNKVASSQVPFSFSLKTDVGSTTSDVAVTAVALGGEITPAQIPIDVTLKNQGGRAESNITVTLYISGMVFGTYKVPFLNVGETKVINFKVEPASLVPGQPLFVSATHDLFDSNFQNNIFTTVIRLNQNIFKDRLAKILGRITMEGEGKGEGKGIESAKISYEGPKAGEVLSGDGGQYKIEGLPTGIYQLKVTHADYKEEKREISIEEAKPYTNVDFKLVRKESKQFTLDEIWGVISEKLSSDILKELNGYQISEIKGAGEKDVFALVDQLKNGKAKITEANIEY
ncbi:MAG: CARDB domain-containing protein [Elusimicrobiota bacterium]